GIFVIPWIIAWTVLTFFVMGRDIVTKLWREHLSSAFQSTQGVITSSEVVTHTSSKGKTSHEARVAYRYSVGGNTLTGNHISAGSTALGAELPAAEAFVR